MRKEFTEPVLYSLQRGELVLAGRSETHRKQNGQFLTPEKVARFMARQLGPIREGDRILDPAIGSGTLACAVIERVIAKGQPAEFWIDGYDIDRELCQTARKVLENAAKQAESQGIQVHTRVYEGDFILNYAPAVQLHLFSTNNLERPNTQTLYDHIIANPPYFKLNSNEPRVKAIVGQVKGHTNIYTLFMALAAQALSSQGRACFIVPRSFCSGAYFSAFRQDFIQQVVPLSIHLFESRQDTFKKDSVLQENVILTFRRRPARKAPTRQPAHLNISTSKDATDLDNTLVTRRVLMNHFIGKRNGTTFFRLPTGELDEQIVETIDSWTGSLIQCGLNVSTGPVVAFRARSFLTNAEAVTYHQAVPLLWMQNVKPQQIKWPVASGNKPQGISLAPEAASLLLPVANYVLIRRFSAKEEPRRLIAAPFLADHYHHSWIGLENHLNYIYRNQGGLETEEVVGLSALFNSALIDRYFRIANGNTQVNATELRSLPLPPLALIRQIGKDVVTADRTGRPVDANALVFSTLRESGYLPPDFPTIKETRTTMGKMRQTREI